MTDVTSGAWAALLDSSDLTVDQVVEAIVAMARAKKEAAR